MGLVVRDVRKRWPGGCIVFQFADELNNAEVARFQGAMAHWRGNADVRFVERTTQDAFVTLKPDSVPLDGVSHSTSIGMGGGEQFVSLDPIVHSDSRTRSSRHELGHALGMYHEQQRRDRSKFISINQAQIKFERVSDFAMVSAGDGLPVGDYDIDSIMHYSASTNASVDGKTPIITKADGTPLPGRKNNVTPGDIASAAELNHGNAHIYQLSNDGQLEKTIQQSGFSAGWTTVSPYTLDVREFLLLLKRGGGSGSLRAFNMNLDGTSGARVANKTVTSGWTSVATYGVLGSTFALMYKSGSGQVKVRRIDFGGNVAPSSTSPGGLLEPGWTSVSHYAVGLNNFLIFVNADTGDMQVNRVNADGMPGERIQARTWSTGWTTIRPFSTGSGNFLFKLKAGNGRMHVERIRDDGKIGGIVSDHRFASRLKVGIPYSVAGGTFVFLLNPDSGTMNIRKIKSNGKVGVVTDVRKFSAGWETAAIYTVGLGKYVILIRP